MPESLEQLKALNVLLGVSGGIAAYKAADLASKLTAAGAVVRTIMTDSACKLIAPATFEAVTGQPVYTSLWQGPEDFKIGHIQTADWADAAVVAPATANIIARLAHGIADDALTCIALALNDRARTLVAPAMNGRMWLHQATQQNVSELTRRSVEFIGPEDGVLSCGYEGLGRLWPVEQIAQRVNALLG